MSGFDAQKTPGTFGMPPAGAPHEVSQPLTADAVASMVEQARRNEKELAPLIVAPSPKVVATTVTPAHVIIRPEYSRLRMPGAVKAAAMIAAGEIVDGEGKLHQPVRPAVSAVAAETVSASGIVLTDALVVRQPARAPAPRPIVSIDSTTAAHLASPLAKAAAELHASRVAVAGVGMPDVPYQPAASNTDTPSRGQPAPIVDPGKRITGGFGDAVDAQYFPLDGSELLTLVKALMISLMDQLDHDLRFTLATCYPRVAARVNVEISCFATDQSFQVVRVLPPHEKTPIEIARQYADEVIFIVTAERVEMDAAGQSISPPNATRLELGLTVPAKTTIQTPGGRMVVDLVAQGS